MAPKRRTEVRYACRLCPNGLTFDRLKKGAESSWKKSLEYHGEKTTEPRPWARKEQTEQEQSSEFGNEFSEEQVGQADNEDWGADNAAAALPAKDINNGIEEAASPTIRRRLVQVFAAITPSVTTWPPIVLRCGKVDQLVLDSKFRPKLQELVQKVFPHEDEDPVPIASQHIVRYLLARLKRLEAFFGELLYEMPIEEIEQIRAEAEDEEDGAQGEEDEAQGEILQEAYTNLGAQQKRESEQAHQSKKRARETPVDTEEQAEEQVSQVPKRQRLVLNIGSSQRTGVDEEHES